MTKCIKKYLMQIIIVTAVVSADDILANHRTNGTLQDPLQSIEVPNSSLILMDRLKLRSRFDHGISEYARHRRKQAETSQNTTSTPTSTSSPEGFGPCSCALGVCKCCTGYILDLFNQKACMKVTYSPGDFAFDVAMSLNDRVLYENSMSGKNPKPICVSPPRLPNLKVCAKFYDVYFPGRNFHFCLAMNGVWRSLQLFNMAFDCLRMGSNGIAMVKPGESDGLVVVNPQGGYDAVIDAGEDDVEDYDENVVKSLLNLFDR